MPNTIHNATQPVDTSNMKLLTSSPAAQYPTPGINSADPEFNSLAIAPIPSILGTDTDAARQFYRNNVSQLRMPPLPTASKIAVGAQAATQVIFQVNGGGSTTAASSSTGVDLQVNNVDNPVQSTLNLTGPGVSYGPAKGQVSIFATIGEIQNNGTPAPSEPALNFLSPLVVTDNPGNGSSDISISLATLFYQTMQQAAVSKPQEPRLNFLAPITVVDNPGNTSTDITVPVFVGSGAGHAIGLVPDPGASAGITRFVCEDGTFRIPPGTGGAAFNQTIQQAGVSKPQEAKINFLVPFVATDNPGNGSTDISLSSSTVQVDLTGQNSNIGPTTIATPGANGYYRISGWVVSTNTPTGAVIPAISIKFTDADASVAQTIVLLNTAVANAAGVSTSITNSGASAPTWSGTFYAKSGVAIQYEATSYTAGSGTALVYALHLRLEGPF
jgi:hypothetical protein